MNLSNLRIGTRLAFAFGVTLFLLAVVTGLGVYRLLEADRLSERLVERDFVKVDLALQIQVDTRAMTRRIFELATTNDDKQVAHVISRLEVDRKDADDALAKLDAILFLPEGKARLEAVRSARKALDASVAKVVDLAQQGKRDVLLKVIQAETTQLVDKSNSANKELTVFQRDLLKTYVKENDEAILSGVRFMIGLGVLALLAGVAFAWLLGRSITVPLRDALAVARRVAQGDLTISSHSDARDEFGDLARAQGEMVASLRSIVGEVRAGTDHIATAGGEIAQGNTDLASRTEEQAASLEQTSASIRHLEETVQRNVGAAQKASELVTEASRVAHDGGDAVKGVVKTMGSIQTSSRKIAEIIGVIDGIAFQTNILALNAAVEAARAGEQGRGFAVVATEVRALAQRSATAAKEIKDLIQSSVSDVEQGAGQVERTTQTIGEVVSAVERAARLMEEIALASREQGEGISEVTKAVGQMDTVTQQNSALVEETAAASESLKAQARALVEVVSRFRMQAGNFAAA
jgi:methyl-accepting chemotaxis protein